MRRLAILLVASGALLSSASATESPVAEIVGGHVLQGFVRLSDTSGDLREVAQEECDPDSERLRQAYHSAFDAWIAVSHLRFGPSETENRAFALAFWPDGRGRTPRALGRMIDGEDPAAWSPESFREVSVAARGFFALEFLLFDTAMRSRGAPEYRCALLQALTVDIEGIAAEILEDWQGIHAGMADQPSGEVDAEWGEDRIVRKLFTALSTGLQFTSEARLGRPLGTPARPRPKRAEARRSLRSSRHVETSLNSLRELAVSLASGHDQVKAKLERDFDRALRLVGELNNPDFSGVATSQGRLRVEILQRAVEDIRMTVAADLGAALGVAEGFNALDGD